MDRSDIWSKLQSYPVSFGILGLLWGGSFVAIEVGLHSLPPLLFAALRYDVAGMVVLAYALATADRWRPVGGDEWLAVGVAAVLVVGCYQALLFTGERYVGGAVAAVVVSLSPVLSAVSAATLVPDRGLRRDQYGGVVLGLVGVVLVVDPFGARTSLLGVGLVSAAVVSFSVGTVLVRPLSPSLPARSLMAWAMVGGAGILHLASLLAGESVPTTWSPQAVGAFLYVALGSGVVGYLLYFELLDRVGAAELNLVAYLEPVVATAVSWALLGQTVGVATLLGFLTIFAGFALVKRDATRSLAATGVRRVRHATGTWAAP